MNSAERRLGLTLSGGGFRATLFHLGVVRLLHVGKLLPTVKYIGSVSGGSILAAHLVLHWDRYTDKLKFDDVAQEIIDFVQLDVRGRVVRRWILASITLIPRLLKGKYWTFTNLLQKFYARLYKGAMLDALAPISSDNRPHVFFYCTSLSTGSVCSFGPLGFVWDHKTPTSTIKVPEMPVAFAVAASSAFPPLFAPVAISNDDLACSNEMFPNPHYLTDGGVYDNLGIDQLIWYDQQTGGLDWFFISDAEGNLDWDFNRKYKSIIPRNVRASALLMKRMSTLAYGALAPHNDRLVKFDIDRDDLETGDAHGLSVAEQRCLRNIRTDLDAFSPTEVWCLIQHGYTVARAQLIQQGLLPETTPLFSWESLPSGTTSRPHRLRELQKSRVRKLRLWSFRDWASWASLLVIASVIASILALIFTPAYIQVAEERQQKNRLRNALNDLQGQYNDLQGQYTQLQQASAAQAAQSAAEMVALKKEMAADKVRVSRLQNAIKYTVNSDLLFRPGSWELSKEGQEIIAKLVPQLAPYQQSKLVVKGYTDNAPVGRALQRQGITSNEVLSQKRAEAVMAYLTAHGVKPDMISAQGHGEADPVAANTTAQGRAQNRRVELTLAGQPAP